MLLTDSPEAKERPQQLKQFSSLLSCKKPKQHKKRKERTNPKKNLSPSSAIINVIDQAS
jgi:hypothetical protein